MIARRNPTYPRSDLHGWILYTAGDRSLNPHYIDLYHNACKKRGMSIELGIYDPRSMNAQTDRYQDKALFADGAPAYVVNRTRDHHLAAFFEAQGIPVFNHSSIARLGNDKAAAYRYMQQRGIPCMPTAYDAGQPPLWYPAVLKSCDGHGGTEVFLIRDHAAWEEWKKQNDPSRYLLQQAASDMGKDVRVYIVGNQIKAAVLRTSKTDFRSNFCLGGQARLYRLSDHERRLTECAIDGLSIGMAGIDLIFHNGEMVFNEIEDMVGARALYSLADLDIVDEYISYIQTQLRL